MNSTFEWGMEKKASARTHTHTYIYARRVHVVFGETATPRVCSKSDNVALERRFVNTLEKMRGGEWFFLSLFFWGYERVFIFSGSLADSSRRTWSSPFHRWEIVAPWVGTRVLWAAFDCCFRDVVTILRVTGRLRFLEKLVESEWNGFCCREGKGMFVRIFFPGNKMIMIEKRLINNLALDF